MLLMTHKVRGKQNKRRPWGASTASEGHSTLLPWQRRPPSEKFVFWEVICHRLRVKTTGMSPRTSSSSSGEAEVLVQCGVSWVNPGWSQSQNVNRAWMDGVQMDHTLITRLSSTFTLKNICQPLKRCHLRPLCPIHTSAITAPSYLPFLRNTCLARRLTGG